MPNPEAPSAPPEILASRRGAAIRVFVVDDEEVIAYSLARILKMSGYDTSFFINPLEALAAARSSIPDLLICDVAMPRLSGVELALAVQATSPQCGILLLSGLAQTADLPEKERHSGHQFQVLSKPIHPSVLLARINDLKL